MRYLIQSHRKVRYVGSTSDLIKHRIRLHWVQKEYRTTQLAGWLRSLSEPPDYWVIQEVCDESRWQAEEYWTDLIRDTGADLLNQFSGRHTAGGKGRQVSEETRKKLSQISPELREQRRQFMLGKTLSDETKRKLSNVARNNISKPNRTCSRCGAGPMTMSQFSNHRRWHCKLPRIPSGSLHPRGR